MPYEGEHSCRLRQPRKGAPTKRKNDEREHNGKKYDVIYQQQANRKWKDQAYRYRLENGWKEGEARSHCKDHGGRFEAATRKKKSSASSRRVAAGGGAESRRVEGRPQSGSSHSQGGNMMKLKELRKQHWEVLSKARAVNDAAKAEDRELTDEESGQIESFLSEANDLKPQMEAAETSADREQRLATALTDLDKPQGRRTEPDSLEVDDLGSIQVGKDRREDDLTCGFRTYTDFCQTIRQKDTPGSPFAGDERLDFMSAAYGQQEATGEDGGFLTPPWYSNRLLERAQKKLGIVEKCDKIVLKGNMIVVNGTVDHDRSGTTYRYGGVIAYWVDEAGQITRSSLKFRKVELRLVKLAALSFCTDEEREDAVINFGDRLLMKHGDAIGDELVEAIMFGNGVGKPLGAFAGDACQAVSRNTASRVKFEDFPNMEMALWSNSDGNAEYYFNPECWSDIRTMKLSGGTGNDPASILDVRDQTIDGRRYNRTDHCAAIGSAGDVGLADFSQYLLAMKGTVQTALSIHLRFDYMETAYRSSFRVMGKPAWDRVLTPRKGSQKVSPFVKLS